MATRSLHPFVRSLLQQVEDLDTAERQACGELLQLEARSVLAKMTDDAVQAMYRDRVARYQAPAEPAARQRQAAYRLAILLAAQLAYRQFLILGMEGDDYQADVYWAAVETL